MFDLDAGAGVDVDVDFDADIDAGVYADADAEPSTNYQKFHVAAKWSSPPCEASQLFNYFVCRNKALRETFLCTFHPNFNF